MIELSDDGNGCIDIIDQRILLSLEGADEPKPVSRIKSEIGERRQSVYYRLVEREPSLIDRGFVDRDEDDPPAYSLTVEGRFVVDSHRETFEAPHSFAELQKEIQEARKEAASAKHSVQAYRKKVSRTKQTAESAAERVEELTEAAATHEEVQRMLLELQTELLESMDARLTSHLAQIEHTLGDPSHLERETLVDDLVALYSIVEYHRTYLDWLKDTAESEIQSNTTRIVALEAEVNALEDKLTRGGEEKKGNTFNLRWLPFRR